MADLNAAVFSVIRELVGRGLTQGEVDRLNNAANGVTHRKTSAAGISLIHGFESYRATTYPDPYGPAGLPVTGGWGTTKDENGKPFQLGRTEAKVYWDRLFARDLERFEKAVDKLTAGVPTSQAQFDALVSFAYNLGEGALAGSTLLKKHRAKDYAGAKAEFGKWVNANGKRSNGLIRRRAAEAALYGAKA